MVEDIDEAAQAALEEIEETDAAAEEAKQALEEILTDLEKKQPK